PILSVVWMAATPEANIWPHLVSTTLPRYLENTGVMMAAVALLSASMGTGAAWLVTMYRFPGVRVLEWLLLLPLAIPAYVGAYALVDFLEYAGPVQTALRDVFGWQSARDYWFPEIRSRGAAVLVLSAGAAIVMMETVNDFGVVDYFAVQTLTTGIFSVWLEGGNAGGAAQIAVVILVLILALVVLEKISRRRMRFYNPSRHSRPVTRIRLTGLPAVLAVLACVIPFLIGFALPVGVILSHALDASDGWLAPGLLAALGNTVMVGGIAALATVL
ncbi:iron ABC transporter permease, partial [Escherichia coli]|nr:iron ABC transporter permease [Escherichia coli]